jgi:hypothetical protein
MSYKETDEWNVIWSPGVDLHTNKQLMSDKGTITNWTEHLVISEVIVEQ